MAPQYDEFKFLLLLLKKEHFKQQKQQLHLNYGSILQ